jgi:hypothetical protein
MSEQNFFERWSRRKREAAEQEKAAPSKDAERASEQLPDQPAQRASSAPAAEKASFDPASLPPIESINAVSDIRAFLAPGVSAELTRAALRRAWVADPAIRDFVGLSENAWDFTAPEGVPGFGTIGTEDVRRLVAQLTGGTSDSQPEEPNMPSAAETGDAPQTPAVKDDSMAGAARTSAAAEMSQDEARALADPEADLLQHNKEDAATQYEDAKAEVMPASLRRGHGGALPE